MTCGHQKSNNYEQPSQESITLILHRSKQTHINFLFVEYRNHSSVRIQLIIVKCHIYHFSMTHECQKSSNHKQPSEQNMTLILHKWKDKYLIFLFLKYLNYPFLAKMLIIAKDFMKHFCKACECQNLSSHKQSPH